MIVFLIIVAVLALLIIGILSLSATVTLVYDKGWNTKIKVLFIEKDVVLSKIISFLLFPEKKANDVSDELKEKKAKKKQPEQSEEPKPKKAPKSNPIKKLWDDEGIVGILSLASNLIETANSAILTLFRGLHIYSLYVMIIVGGGDAADIALKYGKICSYYYPVKGVIINAMKVDNYDDYIQPDFIAPSTEVEFQLIASISVGLLVKAVLKAGIIFLKNLLKNKKGD